MKLYADRPVRLLNQLLGDVLVVLAVYWFVRLGMRRPREGGGPGRPGSRRRAGGP